MAEAGGRVSVYIPEATRSLEDQRALEQAAQHAAENLMPAWPGRSCVDGRYQAGQGSGMISRPGADFGYVMVLLALNRQKQLGMSPQECVDRIAEIVIADSGEFFMHSDQHADPVLPLLYDYEPDEETFTGCGHIKKAANPTFAVRYDVDPKDVKQAHAFARSQTRVNEVSLDGDHEEKDIIVVTGTRRTINSFDQHRKNMYFIYDKTRDEAFMEKLVPQLRIPGLTLEEFIAMSDRHMNETLLHLAPDKRIIAVNADGPRPVVTLAGRVVPRIAV